MQGNFNVLMKRMLDRIDDKYDKRETSLIYQSVAMVVPELLQLKEEIQAVQEEAYPDTCNQYNLLRMCALKNKYPYPATQGIVVGVFNREIEIGTSFECNRRGYVILELLEEDQEKFKYKMLAKEEGHIQTIGELIPEKDIAGLKVAYIEEILTDGKEEEETEHLRKRYLDALEYDSFSGNIVDYKEKIEAMEGVGGVNLFRPVEPNEQNDWNVQVIITDNEYGKASQDTIEKVTEQLKGINTGTEEYDLDSGYGVIPIGHFVTVDTVRELVINIATTISVREDTEDLHKDIEAEVKIYLDEIKRNFGQSTEPETIRISQIESRILDIDGVIDVYGTKINGQGNNLKLAKYQVPKIGSVTYDIK